MACSTRALTWWLAVLVDAQKFVDDVPKDVVRRARRYLELLEESAVSRGGQDDLFAKTREAEAEPAVDPLRDELGKINPDELSPREALELLYRLKKL